MEPNAVADRSDVRQKQQVQRGYDRVVTKFNKTEINSVSESLAVECCDCFLDYIDSLGLSHKANVIVLSATQHYYYDVDDLAEAETIISLKQLNRVKHLGRFLKSIASGLPPGGSLVGCFIDHKRSGGCLMSGSPAGKHFLSYNDSIENGIISHSPVFNRIINIMDSRIFRRLTENVVYRLLINNGFRVENVTVNNGITYFHSRRKFAHK